MVSSLRSLAWAATQSSDEVSSIMDIDLPKEVAKALESAIAAMVPKEVILR